MHPSADPAARKRGTIQIVAELFVFLLLTAATAFLLRPLQADLSQKMADLRDAFIVKAEISLGRQIEYRSMGPSLFRSIDLRDVRLIGVDGEVVLSVERLRIDYSLIALMRGERIGAFRGLVLDHPLLRFNAERDADLLRRLSDLYAPSANDGDPIAFPSDTRIRVRGGSFVLTDKNARASVAGLSLEVFTRGGRFSVNAHADVEYRDSRLPIGFEQIKTAFTLRGDSAADFRRADLILSFSRLETPRLTLLKQGVLVSFSEGVWDLRKTKDRIPFDFHLRFDPKANLLGASLLMENFMPSQSLDLSGAWATHNPWLSSRLSGRAELDFSSPRSFSYRFDLRASEPSQVAVPFAGVVLKGAGDQSVVRLQSAVLNSASGTLEFEGSVSLSALRPEGTLRISDFRLSEEAKVNAVFRLASEGDSLALFSDSVFIGDLRLDAFDARVRVEADVVAFYASALRFEEVADSEATADIRIGRVKIEGSYAIANPYLQTSLSLDSFSAADIVVVVEPFLKGFRISPSFTSIVDNISLTTEIFLTTNLKDLSFNVPRLVVAYRGSADAFSVMSLTGTKERITVRDASVFWKGGSASGSFSFDFADFDDIAFTAQATYLNTTYSIDGLLLDRRNFSLRGDYGLTGNILLSEDLGISGSFSVDSMPIPYAEYRFFTSATASFRFVSASLWSANLQRFNVEETGGKLKKNIRLALQAKADQNGATIADISLEDSVGRLGGEGSLNWRNGYSKASASLRLADQLGQERYEAAGELSDGNLRFRVYGAGVRGSRFFDEPSKLRATGEIRARWKNWADYEADFTVADFRDEINKDEYRLSGSGRVSPDVLDLENVRIAYKDGIATVSTVSVDRRASNGKVSAAFRGAFAGREAETTVNADVSFAPITDWIHAFSALEKGNATIAVGRTRYGTLVWEPFSFRMTKDGATLALDGGPQNSLRLRFEAGGAFFAAVSAPSPIRGNVVGTIKDGRIEARAGGLYLDFASLWSVLNIPDVVFSGGIATGSLIISGPLADPDFFGSATASGFRATVPAWITEEIGPVSASVEFEGKEFGFGPVAVTANKGAGTLNGRFRFDRWVPFEYILDIDISKASPFPAKADVSGFTAQGFAAGKLTLINKVDNLQVAGKLEVENTTMTIDAKTLQSSYAKPFVPVGVTVDLQLVTGKKVEFDWPSSEYPILRGYTDVGDTLGINFDGMTGRYSLVGDIDLRGGEVFYFMRSFYIRNGSIKFNENQIQVDPRLSLRAEIRDQNEEGPVTVSLVVDEARLSSFMPRFESTPPLSQSEILGMLGQNALGADSVANTAATKGAVLSATSDVLAQFNVVRVFERKARELFGFDMFSIRTQLIQNAFFGATGINSDPVDRKAGLGNYFDNTTVYMGKFLGSDIFVQGMLTLQKDESKSTDLLGGLTFAPEIGVEWKTPLFLLQWNFAPDWTNDRERLFINDHSFTLTWRKSF